MNQSKASSILLLIQDKPGHEHDYRIYVCFLFWSKSLLLSAGQMENVSIFVFVFQTTLVLSKHRQQYITSNFIKH